MKSPQRFEASTRMVWWVLFGNFLLCSIAIVVMKEHAAPVLATALPASLALVGGHAYTCNRAETMMPSHPYYDEYDGIDRRGM